MLLPLVHTHMIVELPCGRHWTKFCMPIRNVVAVAGGFNTESQPRSPELQDVLQTCSDYGADS